MSDHAAVALPLSAQTEAVQLLLDLEAAGAVTETSLVLTDPGLPYDQFAALGYFLGRMKRWTSWAIGDWLNFGEGVYGEQFAQAASETGLSEQTLLHYQFVAKHVPAERRHPTVPFGAHALVARLDPREQATWLKRAARQGWGERDLREAMRAKRRDERPPLFPDGEEGVVDRSVLTEVAEAILRDARPVDDGTHYLVPVEDIVRLRAALGHEAA